ncbi:type II toxin-antitoxin system HicB family antitoxin [Herminiimonas arsenitoxidans]|uniref:type II toxin-antitoxin system HicB family antitoxin n=1 Tax=Herminiimonas arsenitoxidans TaxID=1809410 RepID=UPI000970A54C|nr:type II toxin-antitoxin system HicB family antitoxin [Herminiimonas arsenitoxidans]
MHDSLKNHTLVCNISKQPLYKIFLYHDGDAFVANVPELPACSANGATYAEALERVQQAISDWIGDAEKAGVPPPPLVKPAVLLQVLNNCTHKPGVLTSGFRNRTPVRALLIKKFGRRSNRELAACIGIFGKDAPIMLSGAASGSGTRKVRCAIALALGKSPSQLWPDISSRIRQGDDHEYNLLKQS